MCSRCWLLAPLVVLLMAVTAAAEHVHGVIRKVDPDRHELVIDGRGHGLRGVSLTFNLTRDTRILAGHEAGDVADLQAGKRVKVIYETRDDGRRVVLSVTVHGVKKAAAVAAPAAVPADENTVVGTLARIGLTDREIIVIGPGPKGEGDTEANIDVPEKVKITRGDKALKLDDLKEGEEVTVRTEKHDGKLRAVSIQAGAVAAKPAAAPRQQRIERLRQALKIADWLLQQLANRNE